MKRRHKQYLVAAALAAVGLALWPERDQVKRGLRQAGSRMTTLANTSAFSTSGT